MNCILYNVLNNKQINGTLFYAFEYYCFLNKFTDIKFVIFKNEDNEYLKSIFFDKYTDPFLIDKIIFINSYKDLVNLKIKNSLMLDLNTYKKLSPFLKNSKMRVYSNKIDDFKNDNASFYGFYDYQHFHKKTRLKFFVDIHKIFDKKEDKIFVSFLTGDFKQILNSLKLNENDTLYKTLSEHNYNLFKRINKIIYFHTGYMDVNNRIVVESFIHKTPLEVHYNGHYNDSVFERTEELNKNGLKEFILDENDILIKDFLKDCNDILSSSN
jgi:hypothetical protein